MLCDYCEEAEAKEGSSYCQYCEDMHTTEVRCQGCEKIDTERVPFGSVKYHGWSRSDAYGIPTGIWCDECYNGKEYPYKKDKYDYAEYGETMEDDY